MNKYFIRLFTVAVVMLTALSAFAQDEAGVFHFRSNKQTVIGEAKKFNFSVNLDINGQKIEIIDNDQIGEVDEWGVDKSKFYTGRITDCELFANSGKVVLNTDALSFNVVEFCSDGHVRLVDRGVSPDMLKATGGEPMMMLKLDCVSGVAQDVQLSREAFAAIYSALQTQSGIKVKVNKTR